MKTQGGEIFFSPPFSEKWDYIIHYQKSTLNKFLYTIQCKKENTI